MTMPENTAMAETAQSRATEVIERHLREHSSARRPHERAAAAADALHQAGLLSGQAPRLGSGTVEERAAAILQCRYNWPVAEAITCDLVDAGLLRQTHNELDQPR